MAAPNPHSRPEHARAIAPGMGVAIDSKNQRFKYGPHAKATVGPDTIIILHGRPPKRAHQYHREGGLPPELLSQADNPHPHEIVHQLATAAHKELPMAAAANKQRPPPKGVAPTPQLPMAGL